MIDTFKITRSVNPNVFRFYIDNIQVSSDKLDPWVPLAKDGDLQSYIQRLLKQLGGRTFFLNFSNIQTAMPDTFRKLNRSLKHLFSEVGIPTGVRSVELELFLGNYSKTPGGIHQDSASVFCFPFLGKKAMRVWPDQAFRSPDALARGSNKKSTLICGDPGDLIFWPHSYWHVAESNGGMNGAINLAVFYDLSKEEFLDQLLDETAVERTKGRGILRQVKYRGVRPAVFAKDKGLPKNVESQLGKRWARNLRGCLDDVRKLWLKKISAAGFRDVLPITKGLTLSFKDTVRLHEGMVIYHEKIGAKSIFACGGRLIELPYHRRFSALAKEINASQNIPIDEICTKYATGAETPFADRNSVRRFMEVLCEYGAIKILD